VSGSNLKVPNPYRDRARPRSLGAETAPPLAFANFFFEERVREDLWLSATCAVVGNGEQSVLWR
jgi:hypothetical protein